MAERKAKETTTMAEVTARQARKNLTELVNRAAFGKERVVLTRHGHPLAAIVPIEDLEVMNLVIKTMNPEAIPEMVAVGNGDQEQPK